jgi:hypothetical protein
MLEKVLYSDTHSGDVIELTLLPALELEIHDLLEQHGPALSEYLVSVLHGILGLIEAAKREKNPIAFV